MCFIKYPITFSACTRIPSLFEAKSLKITLGEKKNKGSIYREKRFCLLEVTFKAQMHDKTVQNICVCIYTFTQELVEKMSYTFEKICGKSEKNYRY